MESIIPDRIAQRIKRDVAKLNEGEKILSDRSEGGYIDIAIRPQNSFQRVREFMEKFNHPVLESATLIENQAWEEMRLELIREEFCELLDALGYSEAGDAIREVKIEADKIEYHADLVAAADALGDLEYVTNGMALGMGINLPEVVKEIHRSNMTKLGADGKPVYREDGKILKGPGYEPPVLEPVLGLNTAGA